MRAQRSPHQRRATKRAQHRAARARAPKHPAAPESQLKIATEKIFRNWHKHLAQVARTAAEHHRGRLRRQDADTASDGPASSVLRNAWGYALQLLHTSPFRRLVDQAAQRTAKSAADQTRDALGLGDDYDPDLDAQAKDLSDEIYSSAETLMQDSITRASDVLDEWDGEDLDELDDDLQDGLAGIAGKGIALASLAFGYAFAQLIKGAQKSADVGQYLWMAQRDSVVRPEHLALDNGDRYEWDDPPLTADKSSNEEDDHPGEDYNCRCVASPVPPEETDDDED